MYDKFNKYHFVGIGGIGMSAMARVLLKQGYTVTGSDLSFSEITESLIQDGIKIFEGHDKSNVTDAEVIVYTSAASEDNPEIVEAKEQKRVVIKRSVLLSEMMRDKFGICIAGTHGKTTTTAMISLVMIEGMLDPTVILGGNLNQLENKNARSGKSNYMIVEADEYDRTFLKLSPVISVLTNLELDHTDIYKDLEDIKKSFVEFASRIPFYGCNIICSEDKNLKSISDLIPGRKITYGFTDGSDFQAVNVRQTDFNTSFEISHSNESIGSVKLKIPGKHNVLNALAAVAAGRELGIDFESIKKALENFKGVQRRFEIKYDKEVLVIDDYAHHPTETSATLLGIKESVDRRLVAVFQPHLYSRTKDFYKEFAESFIISDVFICTDIYPARELPVEGVSGELITNAAKQLGHGSVYYVKSKTDVPSKLYELKKDGDVIITMGAGDIWKYGERFIELLKN
ncbi:MAG: UDP-N-acetylmuramate--L-alanine ligase [Ignavibacteriaceae bacterium]|nr:UDP-N-acetylmuramate--L-alanine ligase [Ignavibacteriaceae bacterium]